ncbi:MULTISPECIES: 3-hydroxy-5-phosphonooxypentane-2,4-dione thiolase [unclassified Microbacterium]|uniref:3-hydroxy-5-phosphonooxypentane-2,4-dione thiolase n=1 Tax=unclassified Microbacterium TaxID=2609290 RepID=UPI00097F54DC|nr:3-hydroxy-5-phosphonooxypentane-2,4-dione thiolase [Microbacterium sp. JB110]RCS58841.1 3-hydroxy-5-phosphonooxypentane-2,4-dione thiolase [Microbacterium sp. JB110]SJM54986.1 Autoinducer 2 (AI-2) aldolase LsrF [Frigoribacterium sp. JB110]
MADLDDIRDGTDFGGADATDAAFPLKGASGQDWGMRSRLARIFDPTDARTVMLAFDHGYFQGPTSGLERLDRSIVPLIPQADALMCTRGALRSTVPANSAKGVVLRASGGPSVLKDLSNERIAVAIDDAVRLDVAALAVQTFVGGEHETQSIENLTTLVDRGQAAGIPVLGVTAVGRDMVRDARYFRLATRIPAELGASFIKTYYVEEGFETVTASCPVPIIIAGGKKVSEREALTVAYRAMQEGAAGVDMGRNVFQSEHPAAMLAAVRGVVHDDLSPDEAFALYEDLSH